MAEKLQNLLKEVGSKLQNPPSNKDVLIKLLKQAASSLFELEQSPSKAVLEIMQPFINAIVKPELLKHHDKEVKLLVATCTCEITRVTAPEAPYDDDILKDIFHLIVSTFSGLRDTKGPSFGRRVTILETVAKYRSCIVMLDLECDDLVNEMFTTFFAVASDEHSEAVITSMKTIMVVLLEESEDINEGLLLIILSILGRDKKGITMAARKLAMNVIGQCAGKLEPGIKHFIVKSMSGEESNSQIDYHEIIYDIYRCAPQTLAGIVPYLIGELLTDKIEVRLKTVKLVGDLFSIPGCSIPDTFKPIFLEFLKRLTDRVVEVRMSVLEHIKLCMLSNPFRSEAPQLIVALCDRLLDYDENIRQKVVAVVSDIACHEYSSISTDTIKLVADRLRDKSVCHNDMADDASVIMNTSLSLMRHLKTGYLRRLHLIKFLNFNGFFWSKNLSVKKFTMERLSDIYRSCCSKLTTDDYDWIPGRVLRCFYDKDFRSDTVEHILCTSLFPAEFSVKDNVKIWVRLFSKFDKIEIKALEKILEQKQRLQLELQKYLSLRQMHKESDASEVQKKITVCFRFMSHCFTDPTKAEADFLLLHQLKDVKVWKILTTLLDPTTSSLQTSRSRDELLKIVGQKHPLYGILSILSMKCSYILFNKDYVKHILLEVDLQKSSGNKLLTQSCMIMLVVLASFSPLLFSRTEKDLVHLLEDDNDVIKEGVLHILAKAGGTIREQLGQSYSTLDLILERICLEGSRRQAKYAVHALAAITKDDGLKSLSVLYKKLVDMLDKKTRLSSVLQSLGCIAQTAMPVFETQEKKVQGFIKRDILGSSEKTRDKTKESWDDRTELCSLKIFGIKTLVKSYLPVKEAHLRVGINELIKDLQNILSFGEISKHIESSCVDKAHLKLASAKAILRLSKRWDNTIPVDVFYLTLRTSEVEFPDVKKLFLKKVHQYIKDRSLDPKYACAFLLGLGSHQSVRDLKSEENRNLNDIIQMFQQGKARQSDGNISVVHILPYLINALAHHPSCPNIDECKDVKAYELIYRKLYLFISMLALGDEEGKPGNNSLKKEEVISVLSILGRIRSSEDAVDTNKSKKSYAICDLCFSITKRLTQNQEDLQEPLVHVSLPQVLYKPHVKKDDNKAEKEKEDEKKHVTEGHTWLADVNAVAHFESLNLEVDDTDLSKSIDDDMLKDFETDGNEVPLGEMLKRLKAKGAKEKKAAVINESTPAAPENNSNNNNVDILGMVREIDLENSDVLTKFDSINGHEKTKSDEKRKRKRIPNESIKFSLPKRQRPSSAKSGSKEVSAFDNIKMSDGVSENKLDLRENSHIETEDGNMDDSNLEKPKKYTDVNGNHKATSVRKRKRRSVAGLTKYISKQQKNQHTTDLIGRRIRVWWPMDKAFYEGLVKSYDHQKKKHVVLYEDGDVEVIRLDKERWELLANTPKPTKRNRLSKNPLPQNGSSRKKMKVLNNLKKYKESSDISSSMVRGKRTPRKNTKQGRKAVSRKTLEFFEVERKEDSEPESEREFEHEHEEVTFSKVDNLDTEEEDASDREGGNSDAENRLSDNEQSSKENVESNPHDRSGSNEEQEKESPSSTMEEANMSGLGCNKDDDEDLHDNESLSELSDDMPLGVWKSQVRKTDESK